MHSLNNQNRHRDPDLLTKPTRGIQLSAFPEETDNKKAGSCFSVHVGNCEVIFNPQEPFTPARQQQAMDAWTMVQKDIHKASTRLPLMLRPLSGVLERVLRNTVVIVALGKYAVLPFSDVLDACGISRDVGEKLREQGKLEPLIVKHSRNPRLYITVGAWNDFVRKCKQAPPPSRSSLSKAKTRIRRRHGKE